jgi:tetratricopeptide (TPR) repeat protein
MIRIDSPLDPERDRWVLRTLEWEERRLVRPHEERRRQIRLLTDAHRGRHRRRQGTLLAAILVEEIGGCLINLGLVKGALDDHQAAAECYARAAVTFERTDNLAGQATAYGNGAFEQFVLGQPERASELADRAMRLAAEVGNHLVAADVHHTLGLIGESRGDFAAALAHANAAIGEFELAAMPDSAAPSRELAKRARDAQRTKPGRA